MTTMRLRMCICLTLAALGGCTTIQQPQAVEKLFDDTDPQVRFAHERAHLEGAKPKIGLALSGGGTKAAVFSHGVLHGLQDGGILPHVDIISTTSGGGYAAYWYFSKRMEFGDDYAKVFADCFPAWTFAPSASTGQAALLAQAERGAVKVGMEICRDPSHLPGHRSDDPYRWQAHLLRWPDVFKPGLTSPAETQQVFPAVNAFVGLVASLIEGPFNLLGGGDDSYVGTSYQYGIERAWGLNPLPRDRSRQKPETIWSWKYSNESRDDPRWTRDLLHVDPATMQWSDLRKQYGRQANLPLWILNTTEGQKKERQPDPDNLFELTPFSYGSPRWGYLQEDLSQRLDSISKGVRASAAFADSQGLGNEKQLQWLERLARVFPALTWGVPFKHPRSSQPLRLSDGGGADNLGLVSAMRRDLEDIIVVDTAQDVAGRMDDLCWSRALLAKEGFTMHIPALENLQGVCASQIDEPQARAQDRTPEALAYNVSAWLNPVIHGTIRREGSSKVTNIWLIKAAWNELEVWRAAVDERCGFAPGDVNCFLAMFWLHEFQPQRKQYLGFPQHGTTSLTLNGRSSVTLAYRELGRTVAQNLVRGADGRLSLRKANCLQPVRKMVKGARPDNFPALLSTTAVPACL
jgi:hypothetical protein